LGFLDDDTSLGLLGGAASFGQGFMKGMNDAEDRKFKRMEYEARAKARETEAERHEFNKRLEAKKAGLIVPPMGESFDPGAAQYDPKWVEMQERLRTAGALADPYGAKAAAADNARAMAHQRETEQREKERRRNVPPVQGYQRTDNYVADPTEERQLRGGQAATRNFVNLLDMLKSQVSQTSQGELTNPLSNKRKQIDQTLRDLQLAYKNEDFAKLGVLAGPDMQILEQVIENPGSLSNLVSGKAGVIQRYDDLRNRAAANFDKKAQSYGLVPVGGNGLINATVKPSSPQPGDEEDGHIFMGGDPADPKSWKKKGK
jgi:hypothetical protein